jgi:hypothetical protein
MSQLQGATVYSTNGNKFMVYQMVNGNMGMRLVRDATRGYWETSTDGGNIWTKGEPFRLTLSDENFCDAIRAQAKN